MTDRSTRTHIFYITNIQKIEKIRNSLYLQFMLDKQIYRSLWTNANFRIGLGIQVMKGFTG